MYSISISTLYFELSHGLFINSAKYPDMQMGVKYIQPQIQPVRIWVSTEWWLCATPPARRPVGGFPLPMCQVALPFTSINLSFRYIVFHPLSTHTHYVGIWAIQFLFRGLTIMCNVTDTVSIQGESYNLFMCFNQISSEVTRMGNWSLHFSA